ncbi:MAG: mechanosensitive ion channel [bacterium]
MEKLLDELQLGWAKFADYLPQLLAGLVLIIVAYVLAKIIAWLVEKAVNSSGLGKKYLSDSKDIGASLAQASFWLTILFFLPAILSKLGLQQTLGPVQSMIDGILTYTPKIIGALFVTGIGIFIASIVRQAITSLLNATPIDEAAERIGISDVIKGPALANAVGLIGFFLVAVPVIIGALDVLAIEAISEPARTMLEDVMITLPNILGAGIVLLVAFLIGRMVKSFLMSILPAIGFDKVFSTLGFATSLKAMDHIDDAEQMVPDAPDSLSASAIVANIVMVAIILFGLTEAVSILNFVSLTVIFNKLLAVAGRILMGAVVILAGIFVARFVSTLLRSGSNTENNIPALIAQYGIIILVSAMGLQEMGLGEEIIMIGFTLILASAALAAGLAFGIGGRESAHKLLEEMRQKKK